MTPVPGSDEALQQHIEAVRRGLPDYERMTPEAAARTRELLQRQQAILSQAWRAAGDVVSGRQSDRQ